MTTNENIEKNTSSSQAPSRNEPCPCGSGKKYKRCCGVSALPRLSIPKSFSGTDESLKDQEAQMDALKNMDPQAMMQITQAIQKLPKGQIQRLQVLMQKAMSGKDISAEAAEFEKTLPLDFQNMMHSMSGMFGGMMPSAVETAPAPAANEEELTEEKARALIAEAAAQGKISKEDAAQLLAGQSAEGSPSADDKDKGKFGKFWRNLSGKKE